jgi:hypothetical protein
LSPMLTTPCMKAVIVNPTKTSRTGFERSRTSRTGSEPSKRPSHSGDKGMVVTALPGESVAMSDDSQQVTALIKELLILNRAERSPTIERLTEKEIEGRETKRRRIRQELVQVLHLRNRKKS